MRIFLLFVDTVVYGAYTCYADAEHAAKKLIADSEVQDTAIRIGSLYPNIKPREDQVEVLKTMAPPLASTELTAPSE